MVGSVCLCPANPSFQPCSLTSCISANAAIRNWKPAKKNKQKTNWAKHMRDSCLSDCNSELPEKGEANRANKKVRITVHYQAADGGNFGWKIWRFLSVSTMKWDGEPSLSNCIIVALRRAQPWLLSRTLSLSSSLRCFGKGYSVPFAERIGASWKMINMSRNWQTIWGPIQESTATKIAHDLISTFWIKKPPLQVSWVFVAVR